MPKISWRKFPQVAVKMKVSYYTVINAFLSNVLSQVIDTC